MSTPVLSYSVTMLRFIIQYCVSDTNNKIAIGNELVEFLIFKLYLHLRQVVFAYQQKDKKQEVDYEEMKITIPLEIWEQGILGNSELEAKVFKLLRSILQSNSNMELMKEACSQVTKVRALNRDINDYSEYFKAYEKSCPRELIKKFCRSIRD
jgi:lipid-A-disaccharide synthase-like uncharacterized protein